MRNNQLLPLNLNETLKLGSVVGNDLSKYNKLTFIITGEGSHNFKDDLGNEIDVIWTKTDVQFTKNILNTEVSIIRLEELSEQLW